MKRRSLQPAAPKAAVPTHRDTVVAAIARRILDIETLAARLANLVYGPVDG